MEEEFIVGIPNFFDFDTKQGTHVKEQLVNLFGLGRFRVGHFGNECGDQLTERYQDGGRDMNQRHVHGVEHECQEVGWTGGGEGDVLVHVHKCEAVLGEGEQGLVDVFIYHNGDYRGIIVQNHDIL